MEPLSPPRSARAAGSFLSDRPPSSRPSRSRAFHCHDALWQDIEQAAREQGCAVDPLIEKALMQYLQANPVRPRVPALPPTARATQTSFVQAVQPPVVQPPPVRPPLAPPRSPFPLPSLQPPGLQPPQPIRGVTPPQPIRGMTPPQPIRGVTPPQPVAPSVGYVVPPGPATPVHPVAMPPPAPPVAARPPAPPPVPRAPPPLPRPSPPRARLTVSHAGQTHVVDIASFTIGRKKQQTGFAIKNANVSGVHAVIEEVNGAYYLVDMDSTNGTLVNGVHIKRHLLQDGDVAVLAEEELHFRFSPR